MGIWFKMEPSVPVCEALLHALFCKIPLGKGCFPGFPNEPWAVFEVHDARLHFKHNLVLVPLERGPPPASIYGETLPKRLQSGVPPHLQGNARIPPWSRRVRRLGGVRRMPTEPLQRPQRPLARPTLRNGAHAAPKPPAGLLHQILLVRSRTTFGPPTRPTPIFATF